MEGVRRSHVPEDLFEFPSDDGAENYCQSGALSYKDEIIFKWLENKLKPHGV